MSTTRLEELHHENRNLKEKIHLFRNHQNSGNLRTEIVKFVEESKKNLGQMNKKIVEENAKQNQMLHGMTGNYENVLKRQIELLTQNKGLSQQKEEQDKIFNENIEKLTQEYEEQIKVFENKVKANVKKIQDLSGGNIINRLLRNKRFRQAMADRGCSLQSLQKQSKLQQVSQEVEEKEKEIQVSEQKSSRLDQQLGKMHELIDTMKSLLQNMMKEKQNILKQNAVLKQKLKQSEELIGKLLGGAGVRQEEDEGAEQDQVEDEDEVENEEIDEQNQPEEQEK